MKIYVEKESLQKSITNVSFTEDIAREVWGDDYFEMTLVVIDVDTDPDSLINTRKKLDLTEHLEFFKEYGIMETEFLADLTARLFKIPGYKDCGKSRDGDLLGLSFTIPGLYGLPLIEDQLEKYLKTDTTDLDTYWYCELDEGSSDLRTYKRTSSANLGYRLELDISKNPHLTEMGLTVEWLKRIVLGILDFKKADLNLVRIILTNYITSLRHESNGLYEVKVDTELKTITVIFLDMETYTRGKFKMVEQTYAFIPRISALTNSEEDLKIFDHKPIITKDPSYLDTHTRVFMAYYFVGSPLTINAPALKEGYSIADQMTAWQSALEEDVDGDMVVVPSASTNDTGGSLSISFVYGKDPNTVNQFVRGLREGGLSRERGICMGDVHVTPQQAIVGRIENYDYREYTVSMEDALKLQHGKLYGGDVELVVNPRRKLDRERRVPVEVRLFYTSPGYRNSLIEEYIVSNTLHLCGVPHSGGIFNYRNFTSNAIYNDYKEVPFRTSSRIYSIWMKDRWVLFIIIQRYSSDSN